MAKLYWSGDVGYMSPDGSGITVNSVRAALDALGGADLEVELSTYGGDWDTAIQILNLLRNYKGKKTVYYNGVVASAGTLISLAFTTRIARNTSSFMIHGAQVGCYGNADELREMADWADKINSTIIPEYAAASGQSVDQIKEWMNPEKWFMGQEIVDAGFAGSLETVEQQTSAAMALLSAKAGFKAHAALWSTPKTEVMLEDKTMSASLRNAERLVKGGKVNKTDSWSRLTPAEEDELLGDNGDDWQNYRLWFCVQDTDVAQNTKERYKYPYGKQGVVYRSALRSIASRAAQNDLQDLSDWASGLIKTIDAKGDTKVDENEIVAYLKDKPAVFARVGSAAGHASMMVGEKHAAALALYDKLAAEKIADPLKTIAELRADLAAVDEQKVKNTLDAEFGPDKDSTGTVNQLRGYAAKMLAGVKSAELAAKIEEFKKDPLAVRLAGERMDAHSDQNVFRVDPKPGTDDKKADMFAAPVVTL